MQMPKVTEISIRSAHDQEVARVRGSLAAVPDRPGESVRDIDPLRRLASQPVRVDGFSRTW